MKRTVVFLLTLLFSLSLYAQLPQPKREFRGAWIQMINGQFMGMDRDQMQQNLTHQLDELKACRVNTIIFQVRGEADAMYASQLEPWTRFLSGQQGVAPNPYWDPLEWMIKECHRRGMELHAWINPYRAKTKTTNQLAASHPYNKHPERFFAYDNLLLFNPGLQENRDYICQVVADIVSRYDIDGLHIDDYFYPYPNGTPLPDADTFKAHSNGFTDIADWRRYNVNLLIRQIHATIKQIKPWVAFGVSPFGIYHNAKTTNSTQGGVNLPGSATNGLQNYDDLYADILYWTQQGWCDYLVPQLYWEIGHKAADYTTLVKWWSKHVDNCPLIVGQDIERSVRAKDLNNPQINQLPEKFRLQRTLPHIQGNCLWYSAAVVRNEGNAAVALKEMFQSEYALPIAYDNDHKRLPAKVKSLGLHNKDGKLYLYWLPPKYKNVAQEAVKYVVYCFGKGEKIDIGRNDRIIAVTPTNVLDISTYAQNGPQTYVVTAFDRMRHESKPAKVKYKPQTR